MTTSAPTVTEGLNGRLFLARQDSFELGRFLEGTLLSEAATMRWRRTLRRRAAELHAIGIPYVFYIVPDAPSVCFEDLPAGLPRASQAAGARLAAALQDIPNLTVVFPLHDLLEARGGLPLYRKTDTHWSGFGALVAYGTLCRALARLMPVAPLSARDVQFEMQCEFGDLGSLTTPEQSGSNASIRLQGQRFSRGPVLPGPFRTNSQQFRAEAALPGRLLVLRDSFMTEQGPLIAATFGHSEMVGTTARLFLEHVRRSRPDVVVTQICERRLTEWENDHQLLGYDESFGPDWTTDVGRVALAAEMALGRGRTADAIAAGARLMEQPVLSHSHAFVAARVCLAAGDVPGAARFIGAAIAAEPDRAAYLCVDAQVRLLTGETERSLASAREARHLAPWNGYMHELLCYILLAAGRPREAMDVFEEAAQAIDDHPNLLMIGSMAAEQCGQDTDAIRLMEGCLELWPDNPTYLDRLAMLAGQRPQPETGRPSIG